MTNGDSVHFQLFIPDAKSHIEFPTVCRQRGIEDLFSGPGAHDMMPIADGPQGKHGLLAAWLKLGDRHEYKPAAQTWLPSWLKDADGHPVYFVGIWNEAPPKENELRRPYTREGVWTQFGVEKWLLSTPSTVDAKAVHNDDGTMRWVPLRIFSWMCDEAKTMREQYLTEFGMRRMVFSVEPSAQMEWLAKLLRVNYRIVPEVMEHMEMFTPTQHMLQVFLETLNLQIKEPSNGGTN